MVHVRLDDACAKLKEIGRRSRHRLEAAVAVNSFLPCCPRRGPGHISRLKLKSWSHRKPPLYRMAGSCDKLSPLYRRTLDATDARPRIQAASRPPSSSPQVRGSSGYWCCGNCGMQQSRAPPLSQMRERKWLCVKSWVQIPRSARRLSHSRLARQCFGWLSMPRRSVRFVACLMQLELRNPHIIIDDPQLVCDFKYPVKHALISHNLISSTRRSYGRTYRK